MAGLGCRALGPDRPLHRRVRSDGHRRRHDAAGCRAPDRAARRAHAGAARRRRHARRAHHAAHAHELLATLAPAAAAEVSLAAINGPQDVVFSGSAAGIDAIRARLDAQQLDARPLAVSHAFHSPLLEPMLDDWADACAGAQSVPPRIPVISTLTGAPMTAAPDAAYWSAHARQPVRFSEALERAGADCDVLLEIGAHAVLSAMAQRNQRAQQWPHPVECLASLRRGTDDNRTVAEACADLYLRGHPSTGTDGLPARCHRRARCRAIRSTARAIGSNMTKTHRASRCRCSLSPSARRRARSGAMRCNGSPSRHRPVAGTRQPTGSLPPRPGTPTPSVSPHDCPGPRATCTCYRPRSGPMPPAASPMTTS
ncbi:acyltransferase domain-containing protein [Ralstonia syzygii subsp. celebesensis]